ncbi:hypothetical protein [Ruegeria sp. EL01]|jgi:hypothetical protein|uniref:hypothetical protein n=1 Tax=Ruegeria sp. EL01 TaxID=2107578 RepID=UPI000EA7F327|nr:hypothetical protein [Ruegeria sp. EL01]
MQSTRIFQTIAILAGSLAVLSGCQQTAEEDTSFRGAFTYGPEVRTFQACNSDAVVWLDGDQDVLTPLEAASMKHAATVGTPYQPIFVQIEGRYVAQATDGFAEDYERRILARTATVLSPDLPDGCI